MDRISPLSALTQDELRVAAWAVSDLAYMLVLWWPKDARRLYEEAILRRWYESVGTEDYSWDEALADWLCP